MAIIPLIDVDISSLLVDSCGDRCDTRVNLWRSSSLGGRTIMILVPRCCISRTIHLMSRSQYSLYCNLYLLLIFISAEHFFVDLNDFTLFRAELAGLGIFLSFFHLEFFPSMSIKSRES